MLLPAALLCAAVATSAEAADKAIADILGKDGRSIGTAAFTEAPTGVLIRIELRGLPPGFKAVHIHSVGTCADHDHGFVASKAHLNPQNRKHGLLNAEGPDAGDLPNVYAHADGNVTAEIFTTLASLEGKGGRAAILDADGAALVVHAGPDDHVTQPIGGAGVRVACGVIQAAR
ncbi:MAG: superoxide dismutase family protein [Alphaproteobacteria bacterium]|nr:superoxide dismutase family protein [Alphaproteobacteria bacterium]